MHSCGLVKFVSHKTTDAPFASNECFVRQEKSGASAYAKRLRRDWAAPHSKNIRLSAVASAKADVIGVIRGLPRRSLGGGGLFPLRREGGNDFLEARIAA